MAPPKRPWFRLYVETFTDLEIRSSPVAHRWVWMAMLGLARVSPVAGVLLDKAGGPISDAVLADFAAVPLREVRAATSRFVALGMVTKDSCGTYVVTKWDSRQFESDDVASRVAKHRASNGQSPDDVTPDGVADVTADAPLDVTESPSVSTSELQRTDLPTPSSEEPPGARELGGGIDDRLNEAARLLAEREADRRGSEIANRGGYVRSRTKPIRDEFEGSWRLLLDAHPATTAEQLVASLDSQTTTETPLDETLRAQFARMERNAARLRGEACARCEGVGMAELEDGRYAPCPTCRPQDFAALGEAS